MRKYFLSYGQSTGVYNLDYGCFDRNRTFLGKEGGEELIKRLKESLKLQRKSIIYIQKDLEVSLQKLFFDNFKSTSIQFKFEKSLESLC